MSKRMLASIGLTVGFPVWVGAQSVPAEQPQSAALESITVTSQRREQLAQKVPAPISVLSAADLERSQVGRSAGEIADYIPNASAATLNSHIQPRWWIRGIGAPDPAPTVVNPIGVYIDDVYINSKDATGFPLFDLERVEVLRGPQGTLYGKNTTAGALAFVSRRPTFERDGYATVDVGNYGSKIFEGAVSGGLDSAERLAARLSFHQESRDGYYTDTRRGEGSLTDTATRFQLLGRPAEGLDILLSAHYREVTSDEITGSPLGTRAGFTNDYGIVLPPNSRTATNNAPNSADLQQQGVFLTVNWDLGRFRLTSISAFEDTTRTTLTDGDGTVLDLSRDNTDQRSRQKSQEFRLVSPAEDRLNWILGVHYFTEEVNYARARGVLPGAPTRATYNGILVTQDTDSTAVFGSLTWRATDRFNVTAGLRYTDESKDIDLNRGSTGTATAQFSNIDLWWDRASVITPLTTIASQNASDSWDALSWDLTPELILTDNVRTYLRVARGFRSGGYNGTAADQNSVAVLDPEYLTSYELGVKSEWFGGTLNANASVFYYDYTDIQINTTRASPLGTISTMTNGAAAEVKGFELEIAAVPIDGLRINASLGLLDTEYTDYESAGANYTGNQFGRAPKVTGNIGANYSIPLAGGELLVGADWRTTGHFYFSNTNQTDPLQQQDRYAISNARVSYTAPSRNLTGTLYVRNLTDEDYQIAVNAGGNGALSQNLGAPRTYGVSLTARF